MHRDAAIADNPDVLRRPRRAEGSGDARATAAAGRSNSSSRGWRKVVLTEIPSTRTNDVVVNPLPSSSTCTGADPSCTRLGCMALIVGARFDATIGRAGRTEVKYSGW